MLVSMGPEKAADALRKALAMGADRAVLVADEAAAGSDLVATSRVLARALEREDADLVLFGQQAADSDGAVLWAAVADRLRRPLVSQVAELTVEDGAVRGKRQTEFGYDVIRAPLPAVVAVSDAINEPRYPSLKGIMGAKRKPQDVLSVSDLGLSADEVGEAGLADDGGRARRAARPRRGAPDRGRRQRGAGGRRVPRREEAPVADGHPGLPRAPRAARCSATRSACSRRRPALDGGQVAGVLVGSGVEGLAAAGGRARREPRVRRGRRVARRAAARSRASTRWPRSCASTASTPCSSRSPCSRPTSPRASPRASTPGLNWDLVDLELRDGELVGSRPALADSVHVETGWVGTPRLAIVRSGTFEPSPVGGSAEVVGFEPAVEDFSRAAEMVEQAHEESEGPSIEDAEVIVAGGRGLGGPENFTLVEELAKALGGAVAATRAVVDAGWYPYSTQVGQTGKTVSPKLYIACGISGAIQHKVGMQSSQVVVAINKDPNAPIFEYADLGVVGDVHQVVPKLTELVKQRKA